MMAEVFIDPDYERFEHKAGYQLDYEEAIIVLIEHPRDVILHVNGWSKPWECELDANNNIVAICPTSEKVRPPVIKANICDGCLGTGRTHRDLPRCDQPICSSCDGTGYFRRRKEHDELPARENGDFGLS